MARRCATTGENATRTSRLNLTALKKTVVRRPRPGYVLIANPNSYMAVFFARDCHCNQLPVTRQTAQLLLDGLRQVGLGRGRTGRRGLTIAVLRPIEPLEDLPGLVNLGERAADRDAVFHVERNGRTVGLLAESTLLTHRSAQRNRHVSAQGVDEGDDQRFVCSTVIRNHRGRQVTLQPFGTGGCHVGETQVQRTQPG
jgi:hypothetical protein